MLQAADVAVYGATDWTETELRDEWDELDLEQDAWLVEVDGRLAGVAHLVTRVGGRFIADGYVHPELRGRGVGNQVLGLIEERVLELEPDWPESERIVLESAHLVGDSTAVTLHEARGYAFARRFFRMVIDVTVRPPEPVWPSGVETRPFDVEQDARRLHAAHEESFASEWGFVSRPFEEWRKRVLDAPRFDPALIVLAWEDDELAGLSIGLPKTMGDWGWIRNLGVREPWRRRGLGLALLHESFRRFHESGRDDGGAGRRLRELRRVRTRLYERAGMRVLWRADVWHKELRAGA